MPEADNYQRFIAQLSDGVAQLATSERWRSYLDVQSRFHQYSFTNVLLIAAQCPGATRVAGFGAWRRLHRYVRRGETGIRILAPMVDRRAQEHEHVIRGFKLVAVFDIAQTDGAELPEVCKVLVGSDSDGWFAQLAAVASSLGFRVENHAFDGSVNGDCSHVGRRIRVETTNSPAQRVKTLAHELAHAMLHEETDDRSLAELEAESVAYVVCRALQLDSSSYSFGYVAAWAGGGDEAVAAIKASGSRIQKTACFVLESLELACPHLERSPDEIRPVASACTSSLAIDREDARTGCPC